MNIKLKTLAFNLYLITFISCGFSQSNKKSVEGSLKPVLNDNEYPIVQIDDEFETPTKGEKIIIPEKTTGFVYVVFDSPHENDYSCCPLCVTDFYSNLIVDIPKSGILRYACDGRIHEKMLVEGRLKYFNGIYDKRGYLTKRDSINMYNKDEYLSVKMNGYQYTEYLSIKSALEKNSDKVDLIFDVNSIAVVPYGFHEPFRTIVENMINKKVAGKVAGFQIGTVKDIFKLKKEDYERIKK
ncbi:MAG: hypothetical protein IPH57_01975 [Saprospiraceae bacterium]|nr:hypothetical protein [Saprospiraceae bacterium]